MFSNNAYCFCPEIIIDRISDIEFFHSLILPATVNSSHHVLLDIGEELWLEYLKRSSGNTEAFRNLETWKNILDAKNGKVLVVDNMNEHNEIGADFMADLAIKAVATCRKYIVTSANNSYLSLIDELRNNGIDILSEFNLLESANTLTTDLEFKPVSFYDDLILALSKVAGSRVGRLENEHNDSLRDLLEMKGYDVYDQRRMGASATGLSVGNLDLIIKSRGDWVTIIEPLRLIGISTSNILLHYNKLIDNYNPLRLHNTHLVVYYIGPASRFTQFCQNYFNLVSTLDVSNFTSEVHLNSIVEKTTGYGGIKSFIQQGEINGSPFSCSHTCISFS